MRRIGSVTVVLAVLAVGAGYALAAGTPQKCAVAKSKAASKKLGSKLKCYEKALAKGVAVDATCLAAAETKFNAAITKAEAKGGCALTGDGPTIEAVVNSAVKAVNGFTPSAPPVCCFDAFGACLYVATAGDCPHTVGAPGTVCDGATGGCVAEPATPGLCCSNAAGMTTFPPAKCAGGPEFDPVSCAGVTGTSYPNSLCPPDGDTCVPF
jgi:hypothetical protein